MENVCLSQGPSKQPNVILAAEEKLYCIEQHFETAVPLHSFWWVAKHSKQRPSCVRKPRQTRQMQMQLISIAVLYQLSLWQLLAAWKGAITCNPLLQTGKVTLCFFLTMQFKGHLIDINMFMDLISGGLF